MAIDHKKAVQKALKEAGIQLVQEIPGFASLIEGMRTYRETIEEQQREQLVRALAKRQQPLAQEVAWYQSPQGEEFFKKIVATSLNAEYADKLEFLANALVNGPRLRDDDARREKFVELIRQLSRPALQVLVASVQLTHDGDIVIDRIADHLQWHPALVESCVRELHSLGAFSHIVRWENRDGRQHAMASFMKETPGVAPLTREFAEFILEADNNSVP